MGRQILVATDGSEVATAALVAGLRLLSPSDELVVVEVIDPVERVVEMHGAAFEPVLVREHLELQRAEAKAHVEAAAAEAAAAGCTSLETLVVEGVPGETLVGLASSRGVDLVIMGTHGRSGLSRALLGSVAEYVVRHLRGIPVLLFHPPED